jgi:hypothetical protein
MTDTLTFDAGVLSRGWLATHLATGTDEEVPALYGTLLIETFAEGVRLTATDRTLLLSTWVPADDPAEAHDDIPLDIAPVSTTLIRDPDGRGKALLTYLRKVSAKAAKDELPIPQIDLHIGVPAEDGDEPGFPGMELQTVVIDYPEHERVVLPTVEGTFPDYRQLLIGHEAKRMDSVRLGGDNMARLGQVAKTVGGFVHCTFGGPKKAVAVQCGDLPPVVRGVVMPIAVAEIASVAS